MAEQNGNGWGFAEAAVVALGSGTGEKKQGGGFLGATPVEAIGKVWGDRSYPRRSFLTEERTEFLVVMEAIAKEYELPEAEWAVRYLAAAWAGEAGWDTMRVIEAVRAGTVQTSVTPNREEKP